MLTYQSLHHLPNQYHYTFEFDEGIVWLDLNFIDKLFYNLRLL